MWQPIETAPRDGNEFLACWGLQGNVIQIVRWHAALGRFESKGEPIYGFVKNATAWMPLPEPPVST